MSTASGWFAARPSGTEDVDKIYAESFKRVGHLRYIQDTGRGMVTDALSRRMASAAVNEDRR